MKKSFILFLVFCGAGAVVAAAQTAMKPKPPESAAPAQSAQTRIENGEQAMGTPPIPDDVLKQAAKQRAGNFGVLQRPAMAAGQIQEAWDVTGNNQGVHKRLECGTCVYKVRTREFMMTAIQLPDGVQITQADMGDMSAFDVEQRTPNTIVVLPKRSGVDSSLQVYTEDGRVFSFYLRAEGVNSKTVPDLQYKIVGRRSYRPSFKTFFSDKTAPQDAALVAPVDMQAPAVDELPEDPQDFIKQVKYDPSKLRGWNSYRLWGDKELRPITVFRDDYFTYVQYGDRWAGLDLPTAYVVTDQFDELVNTRVQGTTYIIESTAPLITLKSGKKFMCIQYGGQT